jgi:hypothetical protein
MRTLCFFYDDRWRGKAVVAGLKRMGIADTVTVPASQYGAYEYRALSRTQLLLDDAQLAPPAEV